MKQCLTYFVANKLRVAVTTTSRYPQNKSHQNLVGAWCFLIPQTSCTLCSTCHLCSRFVQPYTVLRIHCRTSPTRGLKSAIQCLQLNEKTRHVSPRSTTPSLTSRSSLARRHYSTSSSLASTHTSNQTNARLSSCRVILHVTRGEWRLVRLGVAQTSSRGSQRGKRSAQPAEPQAAGEAAVTGHL